MDLESGVDFTPLGSAPPSRPMQLRQNQLQRGKKKARTMNPLIQLKQTIALFLVAFGLSHTAQAISPAPDGGYPGGNTAEGDQALFNLTSGLYNTAMGAQVLLYNSTGSNNTAMGTYALVHNEMANNNTAIGSMAMMGPNGVITTGNQNTATGAFALQNNTSANNNTADGFQALLHNTTGAKNTAIGQHSLFNNTTGSSNIALGANAGGNLTMGSNNIDIGNVGVNSESNTIRIGTVQTRAFVKGISGAVVAGASVVVNAGGQLGVTASSRRFKDEIKPMEKASEAILGLKPVTFRYKKGIDSDQIPQFGLVAEQVEKVDPNLVLRDAEGKPFTVRYDAVNAMLLNEFLKEHKKTEKLEATVASLIATVKEQAAQMQKVSARIEASKPAPQVVNNP
jgi:trimeric autotransporter adhesin